MSLITDKTTKLLVIFCVSGLFLLLAFYGMVFEKTIHQMSHLKTLDFVSFYISGRIAREGDWSQVYNFQRSLDLQNKIAGEFIPDNKLFPNLHPPLLLPLIAVLAVDDYVQAYLLWVFFQVLIIFLVGFYVFRIVRRFGWDRLSSWLLAIEFIFFFPLFVGLVKGQDTGFVLLGLVACLSGLFRINDRESGMGLSLLVLRPQLALPLTLPFLFKRRMIWWWFMGFAALLVLICVCFVGWSGVYDFIKLLLLSSKGDQVVIHPFDMYNLRGMLLRLFPALTQATIAIITWSVYLLSIIALCIWWARSKDVVPYQFGLAVILTLFVSPHLHYHDLALLLVPILILCLELIRQGRLSPMGTALLVMGITYYLAAIQLTPFRFLGAYLLMILLAVLLWIFNRRADNMQAAQEIT